MTEQPEASTATISFHPIRFPSPVEWADVLLDLRDQDRVSTAGRDLPEALPDPVKSVTDRGWTVAGYVVNQDHPTRPFRCDSLLLVTSQTGLRVGLLVTNPPMEVTFASRTLGNAFPALSALLDRKRWTELDATTASRLTTLENAIGAPAEWFGDPDVNAISDIDETMLRGMLTWVSEGYAGAQAMTKFVALGFDPDQAHEWHDAGFFYGDDVKGWAELIPALGGPAQAKAYRDRGISLDEARLWEAFIISAFPYDRYTDARGGTQQEVRFVLDSFWGSFDDWAHNGWTVEQVGQIWTAMVRGYRQVPFSPERFMDPMTMAMEGGRIGLDVLCSWAQVSPDVAFAAMAEGKSVQTVLDEQKQAEVRDDPAGLGDPAGWDPTVLGARLSGEVEAALAEEPVEERHLTWQTSITLMGNVWFVTVTATLVLAADGERMPSQWVTELRDGSTAAFPWVEQAAPLLRRAMDLGEVVDGLMALKVASGFVAE